MTLTATGFWTGRAPQVAPDPAYPDGMDMVLADLDKKNVQTCRVELSHPAPSIGHWLIECDICGLNAIVTAAGRPDDPRSVRIACKRKP